MPLHEPLLNHSLPCITTGTSVPFPPASPSAGLWRGLDAAIKVQVVQEAAGSDTDEDGKQGRQRAVLEAAISAALQHANVVTTYAYKVIALAGEPGREPQAGGGPQKQRHEAYKLYIIQELCNGGSLAEALGEGRALVRGRPCSTACCWVPRGAAAEQCVAVLFSCKAPPPCLDRLPCSPGCSQVPAWPAAS